MPFDQFMKILNQSRKTFESLKRCLRPGAVTKCGSPFCGYTFREYVATEQIDELRATEESKGTASSKFRVKKSNVFGGKGSITRMMLNSLHQNKAVLDQIFTLMNIFSPKVKIYPQDIEPSRKQEMIKQLIPNLKYSQDQPVWKLLNKRPPKQTYR